MVRNVTVFQTLLLALVSMLVATSAGAVGLGNITLDSALNQPLRARIEILDLGNVKPDEIKGTSRQP